MNKTTTRCLISVFITLLLVLTVTQPIVGSFGQDNNSLESTDSEPLDDTSDGALEQPEEKPVNNEVTQDNINHVSKSKINGFGKLKKVIVATADVAELTMLLSNYQYNGWIGTKTTNTRGIAFPILEVPSNAIREIEKLPGVLGVYDYIEPTNNILKTEYNMEILRSIGDPETLSQTKNVNAGTLYHGAETAWANGYTGQGVNVATISSGCDFGHYELAGRQAVVDEDFIVDNEVLVTNATSSETNTAVLDIPEYYTLLKSTVEIYRNTTNLIPPSDYTVHDNGTIDFSPAIDGYNWINASYSCRSPYYQYPIAFDPTSMVSYLSEGPLSGTETPVDSWYVNTSSTDLHIYHTPLIDGTNDFWDETNPHESANDTYPLSRTSELKGTDPNGDIRSSELGLTDLFVASDYRNWYIGFSVAPESNTWKRSFDVRYGIYLDIEAGGADTDPLDNFIDTTPTSRPEIVMYMDHTSIDWGVKGSGVNWGENSDGLWSNNATMFNTTDNIVWSKNNTVSNATFYAWDGTSSWSEFTLTEGQPYNETVGIGPAEGSVIIKQSGKRYVSHDGELYELLGNSTVPYYILNFTTFSVVHLTMIKGEQSFGDDFIELSIPKKMLSNVDDLSLILFSAGDNRSHAQDTVPKDNNVSFIFPDWVIPEDIANYTTTTLSNFTFVEAPPEYVVTGVPCLTDYHIGLHPDQNLIRKHYGRPVAVLLTDPNVAGVYDTVYVDLDNDKSFTDELPLQSFSAHNASAGIGPNDGTIRYDNGTIYHDGEFYTLYNKKYNETLVDEADEEMSEFKLEYTNIIDAPFIQWNTSTEIKFLNKTENYTIDLVKGIITLIEPIDLDDDLFVLNYTYRVAESFEKFAFINYTGVETEIELRDWIARKDLDSDNGTGDGKPYPDISGGMVYFIAQDKSVAGETLTIPNRTAWLQFQNIVEDSIVIYINGIPIENDKQANYTIDLESGIITFSVQFIDLISGTDVVTVDYHYNALPLPYSGIVTDRSATLEDNRIPGVGELVAFYGEFELDSVSGTEVASTISGIGAGIDGNKNRLVKGTAPSSKLIAARGGDPFQAWYFAVEGYDGVVGTGDDAQIIAVSSNYPVQESGWDIYSKAADYIGTYYSQGKTCFVAGAGDSGYGYGTVGSPCSSQSVISVGVATQFDYRNYNPKAPVDLARLYADNGPNPSHGEILPTSSKGPNMLGQPEPDLITAGAFLFGSTPLNMDQDTTTPGSFEWEGGQWAWDLWSGSGLSSAATAGILALVYDAYYQVNGEFPDIYTAKALLRSGADNLNYDILTQGAGYTNADRATRLAANVDGLLLDKTYWVPGDYRGTEYDGFVKLMEPGEVATETFTIENKNQTEDATIEIEDAIFHKFGSHQLSINISKTYDDKDIPGVINIEPYIAVGTELLKVTATSARQEAMGFYMGELFDWTDVNENGQLDFPDEQNRMVYTIGSNHLELRYRDPLGRVHDGLAVQIKEFGGTGLNDWTINLDFYNKTDWDWLDFEGIVPNSVTANDNAEFTARVTVPNDISIGSYEGAIYINEKEPEKTIAIGDGIMMYNVSFRWWGAYNPILGYSTGRVDLPTGRFVVPKSTIMSWNNSILYEGVDYDLSGVGGLVDFSPIYGDITWIPLYASWFNMTMLTIANDGSEVATWSGEVTVPNLVRGEGKIVIKKDGVLWEESEDITDEVVIGGAGGGETGASLANKNIVRETIELSLNSATWPQLSGPQSEASVAVVGQNITALAHGNIVPGSTDIYVNGSLMPQTGDVPVLNKEEVNPLNSTSVEVLNEGFAIGGGQNTSKSIWYDSNMDSWYGMLEYNSVDKPNYTILSYLVYDETDKRYLVDGIDINMHIDDYLPDPTHGKFRLKYDPSGHTLHANYTYYNHSIQIGYLDHGNVIGTETSGDYKVYRNGQTIKVNEFDLDEVSGKLTLTYPLGHDEIIEIAYKYNIYAVDTRTGEIRYSDQFIGGENITVNYYFYNYTLDLVKGILTFANPLSPGDGITANYTYANYTFDMAKGIVKFANPILPNVTVNCSYWHYSAMIPVFFNIGVDTPNFTFGGDAIGTDLFNYNELTGGYGYGAGDWRYFYLDIQEQGMYDNPDENQRLFIDVEWENDLTDVDVQVYGGREVVPSVMGNALPDAYGPHTITHVGGSDQTSEFFTTTGGPQEIISPRISGGINVIALHTVGMNGTTDYNETFNARVGTMYVEPTEVKVVSNELYGEQEIRMYSNLEWEGVGGIAAGPSAPESLENLTVKTDDPDWSNYDSFEAQLASGSTVYSRTIEECLIFHVHIWGHTDFGYKDVVDLDLGVFLDGSGEEVEEPDGIVQVDEFVAYGADWDADEEVKLIAPPDGTYLIVIYGFTIVTDPAHFDMDITIVQGAGFDVDGTGKNSLPEDMKGSFSSNQTEEPFNITHLTLTWDLPGSTSGTLQGALYVGPGNGPMAMLIPIEITIDKESPEINDATSPGDGAITNNNRPLISGSIEDSERGEIEQDSVKLYVDGIEVTSLAKVTVDFDGDHAGSGYPSGSAQYRPNVPLADGGHIVELSASDWAKNDISKKWVFTVDTKKPVLSLDSISKVTYTKEDILAIEGSTEEDADVDIMLGAVVADVKRDAVGGFSAIVNPIDGDNILMITATDAAGNEEKQILTVVRDTQAPKFLRLLCLDGTDTNQANTILSGSVNETGTMTVNGDPAPVNSDGSFNKHVELSEGENVFAFEYTDLAENIEYRWLNVTLDTQAPVVNVSDYPSIVDTNSINITGTTEADADIRINGKRVQVEGGTRQQTGTFSKLISLSPGPNTIVIEASDDYGNIEEYYFTVTYDDSDKGVNYAAIGLMVLLFIIGLLIGLFVVRLFFGPTEEPEEDEEAAEDEEPTEDAEELEAAEEDDIEDIDAEPIPTEDAEELEAAEEDDIEDIDAEPIPTEEGMPEDLPEEELPEEKTPEEIADEVMMEEEAEMASEELEPMPEETMEEPAPEETPSIDEDDPKIQKLKQAYEEGKISKELYEKNLKKFQK